MASALNMPISQSTAEGVFTTLSEGLRAQQRSIAKITEMIHVSSVMSNFEFSFLQAKAPLIFSICQP
jgi:hypothetical protein